MVHYSKNDIKCTLPHITTSAIMNNIKGADSVEAMRQRYIENRIAKDTREQSHARKRESANYVKRIFLLIGDGDI